MGFLLSFVTLHMYFQLFIHVTSSVLEQSTYSAAAVTQTPLCAHTIPSALLHTQFQCPDCVGMKDKRGFSFQNML